MFFGSVDPFRCRLGHDEKRQFQINNGNRRFVEESAESTYRRTQNKHQRNCSKTIIYIIIGMDMCETWDVSREQRMNEPENRTHGALQNTHTQKTRISETRNAIENRLMFSFGVSSRTTEERLTGLLVCASVHGYAGPLFVLLLQTIWCLFFVLCLCVLCLYHSNVIVFFFDGWKGALPSSNEHPQHSAFV